jgi:hypothetical protein
VREIDAEFLSVGRWKGDGREPFFGDERDESWRVVARPGTVFADELRDDDLVIYRAFSFRGSVWKCVLVADTNRDALFRDGTDRLKRDTVILRRVLVRPPRVERLRLSPGRSESFDESAEDQPTTPAGPVCERDVAVNDTLTLVIANNAPLPVSAPEIKRAAADSGIRDDYHSVAAVVPAAPDKRLLIFFHGNSNYVTVAQSGDVPARVDSTGHSRVPRWADAIGRATVIGAPEKPGGAVRDGVRAAPIKYVQPPMRASGSSIPSKRPIGLSNCSRTVA